MSHHGGDAAVSMPAGKYYCWSRRRALSAVDGCAYQDWAARANDCDFAIHSSGFLVFLTPEALTDSNEYSEGDPYSVEENVGSDFHQRRFRCTKALLRIAMDIDATAPRILDLGCGEGHITAGIRDTFPDAEVSGLDYSLAAIERAAERFPDIDFVVANAYDPPYAPEYFDVVVCNNLWEHVPDPSRLLAAIGKVIKPGGFVVISTPSRYRFVNLMRVVRGKPVHFMSHLHVTEYSVGQVKELLNHGGFRCEKAYSEPVRQRGRTFIHTIAYRTILPLLRMVLRATGSHHSLESTVFFLGRKTP